MCDRKINCFGVKSRALAAALLCILLVRGGVSAAAHAPTKTFGRYPSIDPTLGLPLPILNSASGDTLRRAKDAVKRLILRPRLQIKCVINCRVEYNSRNALGKPPSWIWASTARDNQTIFLYKSVNLVHVPDNTIIYITADNFFILYINGKKIAVDNALTPGWSHARRVHVGRFLRPGKNLFAIKATNYNSAAGAILWMVSDGHTLLRTRTEIT